MKGALLVSVALATLVSAGSNPNPADPAEIVRQSIGNYERDWRAARLEWAYTQTDVTEADGTKMAAKVRDISAPPGDSYSWEQLPDAIKALQDGKDINYIGAAGEIDMNDDGDATSGVYDLYRFKNGKIDIYSEIPIPKS